MPVEEAEAELGTPRAPACSGSRGGQHIFNRTFIVAYSTVSAIVCNFCQFTPLFRLIKFSPWAFVVWCEKTLFLRGFGSLKIPGYIGGSATLVHFPSSAAVDTERQ